MANLPSNTFLVNYNAKNYNPETHLIPKTDGQIFNQDLVLNGAPSAYTTDHITLNGQFFDYQFNSASDNPFNRSGNDSLTIILKTSKGVDASGEHTLLASRVPNINWILFNPANGCDNSIVFLHDNNRYYYQCAYTTLSSEPNIYAIRVSNSSGYGQSYTDGTTAATNTVSFGGTANRIGFFTDPYRMGGFEIWKGDFYWMYVSTEALTDAEIQQVIKFNEGSVFGPDTDELTFNANSGSTIITLESDGAWTATTSSDWIRLSQYSGETGGEITISVLCNIFDERTGSIVFTDGDNTATLTIEQGANNLAPIIKMFRNGRRIN